MSKFRKKPVVIEAIRYRGDNTQEIVEWAKSLSPCWPNGFTWDDSDSHPIVITTLEGDMIASPGDYIIRGVKGEFYPCKPDIFAATYEPVEGETSAALRIPEKV